MINKIFAVYDDKAKAFINPFFLPEIGIAVREFGNCANNPDHAFCRNPGDYTLFHLGSFDTESAKIEMLDTPENLGLALMHKQQEEMPITQMANELELVEGGKE